ncbi:hypothetical protein HPB50_016090 [Hyalomma asiaticum]|uniref:Uncharacterized protein n=1 Tax=Hyalomma asiaticum TaxID=266040 RepID=A0ACB7TIA5_HYAAI|nr:hypothetical protein HPB50_016090 [Hyalomma asiaticum]
MPQDQPDPLSTGQNSRTVEAAGDAIAAVSLRLPQHWERNPKVWFLQVESQFHVCPVTSQLQKYHHVVSVLPLTAAEEVAHPGLKDHVK